MRILPAVLCLFLATSVCYAENTVEVVGVAECADCAQNNIKASQALSGLHVTIDCKPEKGQNFERRGVGELNEEGKFTVSLPQELLLEDGKLKEECHAQLHSASATPCAAHDGLESTKIVFNSKINDKHTFGVAGKLKFSPSTCTSAFLWPHYKYPPLPKHEHPIYKPKPKPVPVPIYKPKPKPVPVPIYKPKPKPVPVPVYKPKPKPVPVPVYKPKPKPVPVPVYKPKPKPVPVPVYKPKPHPVPVYKPKPKPVPIYKPKPKPSPVPIYEPHPPIPTIPPYKKKPCPPLPKLPPKSYFHHDHPIIGKTLPPVPPYSPIH